MTGFLFRGTWPIEAGTDLSPVGVRRLIVEASTRVDALAADTGCRIVGRIEWTLQGGHLVAEAPAWPTEGAVAA